MGVFTDHPHTAITDNIKNIITSPTLDPEVELPSLLNIIKLQYSGPTEAARAIRKKIKYGSVPEQLKALDLLNAIVVNGGRNMTEIYNDRKLLNVLRDSAVNTQLNKKVRVKIINLAIFWNREYAGQKGYQGVVELKTRMPDYERKVKIKQNIDFMNDSALHDDEDSGDLGQGPKTNADLNRKYKIPVIDLKKESPRIKLLIAESTTSSIDLTNALKSLPKNQAPHRDKRTQETFEKARVIRRKILRYLQLVESEEFLGSLIHANEELVAALQLYTQYTERAEGEGSDNDYFDDDDDDDESRYFDSNSDDDDDDDDDESVVSSVATPAPASSNTRRAPPVKEIDENDPFGDSHAVDESVNWK